MGNFQSTKVLQIIIIVVRFVAFFSMLGVSTAYVSDGNGKSIAGRYFDISGGPVLFGTCILSFMVHHSIPGNYSDINF